jgi:hypothetical protein
MKKTFSILLVLFTTGVFAQTLEEAKTDLAKAETALATQEAAVRAARANVAALTPPVHWEKGGFAALNFNSLGLTNWAAGGISSNSVNILGNIHRNYKKDKVEWLNNLDMAYGLIQNKGETLRKNEDNIDFLTKGNYGITKKLSYSVLLNFKSQFAPGFDFTDSNLSDDDRPEISKFFAPAYLTTSVGLNYNVTDNFSIYLSPATGRFTFVTDDSIAAQNIYIPAALDDAGNSFYEPNFRAEFGALFNAQFAKDLTKKINLTSTLNLFNNFTDVNKDNRMNVDVNWETMINMKLTNYLGASLYTNLIHDNDIAVSLFDGETPKLDSDGNQLTGPRTQFKRLLGLGVQYKF